MKEAIQKTWAKLCEASQASEELKKSLRFRENKADEYATRFEANYHMIMDLYMSKDTKALDVHKQAAIAAISALEVQFAEPTHSFDEDEIFVGPYIVALNVALSMLNDYVRSKLKANNFFKDKAELEEKFSIVMPLAFVCDTPYFDIMCRMLYYEDPTLRPGKPEGMAEYNILEWSDRLYLLEYTTVLAYGINPSVYKAMKEPPN